MESSLLSNKACLLKYGLLDEHFTTPTIVNMELCTSLSHCPLALHFGLSPSFEFLQCGDRTSVACPRPVPGPLTGNSGYLCSRRINELCTFQVKGHFSPVRSQEESMDLLSLPAYRGPTPQAPCGKLLHGAKDWMHWAWPPPGFRQQI